jgi:DNA-binding NarL/FixJ family response regulator
VDILSDLRQGAPTAHISKEIAVVVIAAVGAAWLLVGLRQQRIRIAALRAELAEAQRPARSAAQYVVNARRQLRDVIAQQFEDWGLSASEQEVGLLLLKGLSLKEIAALRATLEKTVRQQASSIYRKAGVGGRHAFAAWFIEDFL